MVWGGAHFIIPSVHYNQLNNFVTVTFEKFKIHVGDGDYNQTLSSFGKVRSTKVETLCLSYRACLTLNAF